MAKFFLSSASGVTVESSAKTLAGAKREATKWMTFGGGSVSVQDKHGNTLAIRQFWQNGNHFGWDKWSSN